MKNEELEDQMVVKTPDYKFKACNIFAMCDVGEASEFYRGRKGLFFDFLGTESSFLFDTLEQVSDKVCDYPFMAASNGNCFRYFVPETLLKPVEHEPEDTFSAFANMNEFKRVTKHRVGNVLDIRSKDDPENVNTVVITGSNDYGKAISLCGLWVSYEKAFEQYELRDEDTHQWRPFGISTLERKSIYDDGELMEVFGEALKDVRS